MNIPERLKALREAHGLSQEQLATELDVDRTTIVKYETGASKPTRNLQKIADYYHVSTDYILGRNSSAEDMKAILMQPKEDKPSPVKQMLDIYHKLTPEKKKQARSYIAFLAHDDTMA